MDTYVNIIDKKPEKDTDNKIPSGAICGNGDLSVILDYEDNSLIIHISKCDFWKFSQGAKNDGGIKAVGTIIIDGFNLDSYKVIQYMKDGKICCKFGDSELLIFVSPDNIIFAEIKSSAKDAFPHLSVKISNSSGAKTYTCSDSGLKWYLRKFDGMHLKYESDVSVCERRFPSQVKDNVKSARFCFAVVTNFDDKQYISKSISLAVNADFEKSEKETSEFWHDYFGKSDVELQDKQLEKQYHGCLYLLGCCMGNDVFPPGLYGNFITDDDFPRHGEYHLNYNYEAPYYCMFSSNHVECIKGYMHPLNDIMSKGKDFAWKFLDCNGIYLPVSIGPKGIDLYIQKNTLEHEILFLGQKSNAAYAAVIPVMHWYSTYDAETAREYTYPYLYSVAEFWRTYLVKENGRYVVADDAVHEVPYYLGKSFKENKHKKQIHAKNNVMSLGLIRMVLSCVIDMETELCIDTKMIEVYEEILRNLSDYPVFIKHGKQCFRYTENGIGWAKKNSVGLQHIYPASQIGLSSGKRMLKTAKNTYFINDRRFDDNGSCSYLPCGARLGVKPKYLIDGLRKNIDKFGLPNMLYRHDSGCIEHLSTLPNTINEMLMQSYDGVIRLFPCVSKNATCSFRDLRADGAFLVSSSMKNGNIVSIKIKSLSGRVCNIEVPQNKRITVCTSEGKRIKFKKSETNERVLRFSTEADMCYTLL